jgi:transcriptional regulator with XRE-family HTH domain
LGYAGVGESAVAVRKAIGSNEHERLCRLLRDLRLARNLRQEDLAERLGVNQTLVSKVERGERRLDLVELQQYLAELEVTLIDFVRDFVHEPPTR